MCPDLLEGNGGAHGHYEVRGGAGAGALVQPLLAEWGLITRPVFTSSGLTPRQVNYFLFKVYANDFEILGNA